MQVSKKTVYYKVCGSSKEVFGLMNTPTWQDEFTLILDELIEDNSTKAEAARIKRDANPANAHLWKERGYFQGLYEAFGVARLHYTRMREGGHL